jgi:hypothetical protein
LDVALLGGIQSFQGVASPGVALRIKRPGSPWSLEAGATIPEGTGSHSESQAESINGTTYNARVKSFYELHLTVNRELPHGTQTWLIPDADFGVSALDVTSEIDTVTPVTAYYINAPGSYSYNSYTSYGDNKVAFCPLFRVGLTLFPDKLISLRSDVAYVGYANTVSASGTDLPAGRQAFDLGFSGMIYRGMLQVRL